MTIPAQYENGVFRPLGMVRLKEGTLVEVLMPAEPAPAQELESDPGRARASQSIRDLPFFGMWKDRTDIGEGVDYVNNLRDNPRG